MKSLLLIIFISVLGLSCAGGGGSGGDGNNFSDEGNTVGSSPINGKEDRAYKRAILKCYKTGGSRVVKIEGKLRCY